MIFFLSLFIAGVVCDGYVKASDVLIEPFRHHEENVLRNRTAKNRTAKHNYTFYNPLPQEEKKLIDDAHSVNQNSGLDLEEDLNEVLLSLGKIGEDFRNSNLTQCRKELVKLRTKKDPRSYYLLAAIYENKFDESGVTKFPRDVVKNYTLAFINSEDYPCVRRLSVNALERCRIKADPSKKIR